MPAALCQLIHVSWFMSADSCQLIHASWLRSVEFRLAGYISCLDQLNQIIWIYQLLRSAGSEYMDISAGSVCVNKAAVSISCSCCWFCLFSCICSNRSKQQLRSSDPVMSFNCSMQTSECDFDNNVSNIKSTIVSKNQNINNERHKKVFAVK